MMFAVCYSSKDLFCILRLLFNYFVIILFIQHITTSLPSLSSPLFLLLCLHDDCWFDT